MKVQKGDVITINVANTSRFSIAGADTVYADVTFVSDTGRVYFKPIANMTFMVNNVEQRIYAGQVYSTDDFHRGMFTGTWKDALMLSLSVVQDNKSEISKDTCEAPALKAEDLPKHDYGTARFTTKADANGAASVVVDKAQDFFKAFSSGSQHHHYFTPQTKLDSMLTSKCEEAVKSAEEVREAAFITERVVKHGDIEYTVRMMIKAGLTPYQIAEEIQRQFYNAMVNE
ncbi:hypothetical protein [Escherichia phage SUSP2]|uniref:Uncharacterized protein n=1 Tax=Escherichia phage SUSP2 TaxID=1718669 RepID=A0A0N9S0Y9_9CAUD|nr:hypothetical protein AVU06_gp114 [Escherichia phage SUSP2]ALH47142.1 hypothetical protein [Escherichia phage SUSP2]